jgi:hypothetical protein
MPLPQALCKLRLGMLPARQVQGGTRGAVRSTEREGRGCSGQLPQHGLPQRHSGQCRQQNKRRRSPHCL